MATKATKKKKQSEDKKDAPPAITIETVKTVFLRALENPNRGVPALIGPPQWGKTHFMREWLLEREIDRIVMVNPQTDLPEDIAGWPVRSKGELGFTNPSITPAELFKRGAPRWALAIDELDKAKDDTLSAMLTLLNPGERRLRETRIPDKVPIAVAMNEPRRELPEPLVARLLFIPFPPAGFEMTPRVANSTILSPPAVTIPKRPLAPGSYYKLREWFSVPEFANDPAVRLAVVSGLFPANAVPGILGSLTDEVSLGTEWAKTCPVDEFFSMIYLVLGTAQSLDEFTEILKIINQRATDDQTGEFREAMVFALGVREEAAEVQFLDPKKSPRSPEQIEELKAKGERVAKAFKTRNAEAKKK